MYLDPGTGSLIIQLAIGVLVGGLVAAKVSWGRVAGYFRRLFGVGSRHDKSED